MLTAGNAGIRSLSTSVVNSEVLGPRLKYRSRGPTTTDDSASLINPSILNGIYGFLHKVPESTQSATSLKDYLSLIDSFIDSLEAINTGDDDCLNVTSQGLEEGGVKVGGGDSKINETIQSASKVDSDISSQQQAIPSVEQSVAAATISVQGGSFFHAMKLDGKFSIPIDEIPNFKTADTFSQTEIELIKPFQRQLHGDFVRVGLSAGDCEASMEEGVVRWFLEYGCILVAQRVGSDVTSLKMVMPDAWVFQSCNFSPEKSSSASFSAKSTKQSVMECGQVRSSQLDSVLKMIDSLISDAAKITGDKRSAAGDRQGHQKTPSFVRAIVEQAIGGNKVKVLPRGGTSDVGLHIGGSARETCLPCIVAAMRFLIPSNEQLIIKFFAHLHLFVMDHALALYRGKLDIFLHQQNRSAVISDDATKSEEVFSNTVLDNLFQILSEGCNLLSILADDGFEVQDIETKFRQGWQSIKNMVDQVSIHSVDQSKLILDEELPHLIFATEPKLFSTVYAHLDINEVRKRAFQNCDWFASMSDISARTTFADALKWMKHTNFVSNSSSSRFFLRTHQIEHLMFEKVSLLEKPSLELPLGELEALKAVVQNYQACVNEWLASSQSGISSAGGLMYVAVRSLETLVLWIAFCLTHKSNLKTISLMTGYSIPLDPTKLRYLALDSKVAMNACLDVCRYLADVNQGSKEILFDPDCSRDTLTFAGSYAQGNSDMCGRWRDEQRFSGERKKEYEKKVEEKRSLVRSLESELQIIRDLSWNACQSKRQEITDIKRQIDDAKVCPHFVIEPLPDNKADALSILFFFLMPREIEIMTDLLHASQNTLVPRAPWTHGVDLDKSYMNSSHPRKTTWITHYNNYAKPGIAAVSKGSYDIRIVGYAVPSKHGPSDITSLYSSSQCIWYPNFNSTVDSVSGYHPQHVSDENIVLFFTERLPKHLESYQALVSYPSDPNSVCSRGNLAYSELQKSQSIKDCDRRSYVILNAVRSFPCQQIRKVINALEESHLPLNNHVVQTVLRMALYQLGELDLTTAPVEALWKKDISDGDGLNTAHAILDQLATQLRDTPRNHSSILLLGEITAYFAQFDNTGLLREVRQKLASVAYLWVGIKRDESQKTSTTPERKLELRGQECEMAAYGIM
ncbi:hypothetical protein HDU76_014018 [Blyttiomyces sp. JEL0837]|nr:hypothetical protein HDU76_014018 [Blyttiomyces sp. JEL0837]